MTKIRAEIDKIKNKKSRQKIDEGKSWFFENIHRGDDPQAKWSGKQGQTRIAGTGNERMVITVAPAGL